MSIISLNSKTWIPNLNGIECLTYVRERQVNAFAVAAAVASEWRFPSIEFSIVVLLKVNISQKHFFLILHCPKNEGNIWQNSARAS